MTDKPDDKKRDETLKRMLATPPQPKEKPPAKKRGASKQN
jgi:hypothetical protein